MSLIRGSLWRPKNNYDTPNGDGPYYPDSRDPRPEFTWENFKPNDNLETDLKHMYEGFKAKNMFKVDIKEILIMVIISCVVSFIMFTKMIDQAMIRASMYNHSPDIQRT